MLTYKAIFVPDYQVADDFCILYEQLDDVAYEFCDGGFFIWTPAVHYQPDELDKLVEFYKETYKGFDHWVPTEKGLYLMCKE